MTTTATVIAILTVRKIKVTIGIIAITIMSKNDKTSNYYLNFRYHYYYWYYNKNHYIYHYLSLLLLRFFIISNDNSSDYYIDEILSITAKRNDNDHDVYNHSFNSQRKYYQYQ